MSNAQETTRIRVRNAVSGDWKPVHPLLAPRYRLMILLPLALFAVWFGAEEPREEIGRLGYLWSWGLTAVQWLSGLLLLAVALRSAVPGARTSVRVLGLMIAVSTALMLLVVFVTYWKEPTVVPRGRSFMYWYECVLGPLQLGLPLLGLALLLVMRAHPVRPAMVGGLCGLAAGVLTESGWRIFCWVSAPSHVFSSHMLAVVLLTASGAAIATAVDRFRSRQSFSAR